MKERKPATSQEAGELADDHIRARRMKRANILRLPCQHGAGDAKSWKTCRVNLKSEKGREKH